LSTLRSCEREREKNPTEPLPKKNTPLVLNKHTFLHPTTLPTHTQSKQASSTSTHNTECVHLSFLNQKLFYTHLKSSQYQAQEKKKNPTKENLKPQRQPTPSLSLPPSPDIARPALLQRQKNN
jgi:hypothetical protein